MTEDEMVGWHHWFDGHEIEQASGVGDEQGSLASFSPWGRKELDTTEQPNWTELKRNITWRQMMINWNPWGRAEDYIGLLWPLIIQSFNFENLNDMQKKLMSFIIKPPPSPIIREDEGELIELLIQQLPHIYKGSVRSWSACSLLLPGGGFHICKRA